jgi:hypothetical protein
MWIICSSRFPSSGIAFSIVSGYASLLVELTHSGRGKELRPVHRAPKGRREPVVQPAIQTKGGLYQAHIYGYVGSGAYGGDVDGDGYARVR